MGLYELIKDGIDVAQKADNIPLVNNLIEAQKQILDLLHENEDLKKENNNLKTKEDLSNKIERYKDAYITLRDDELKIVYCSCCYDNDNKLIQAQIVEDRGEYFCPSCQYTGIYDSIKNKQYRNKSYGNPMTII